MLKHSVVFLIKPYYIKYCKSVNNGHFRMNMIYFLISKQLPIQHWQNIISNLSGTSLPVIFHTAIAIKLLLTGGRIFCTQDYPILSPWYSLKKLSIVLTTQLLLSLVVCGLILLWFLCLLCLIHSIYYHVSFSFFQKVTTLRCLSFVWCQVETENTDLELNLQLKHTWATPVCLKYCMWNVLLNA